ncbi:MAG: hypothetical protein Q8K96_00770 [Rubrivivax sp.]|nr:hypothetical protein [Rubrivivax sp.]
MNSWLIHPRYFSAYAAAAGMGPDVPDPDLPKGTHLRLFPSAALGLPLAPFLLWPVECTAADVLPVSWFGRNDKAFATPDIDAAGGELIGRRQAVPEQDGWLAGVEARFRGAGALDGQIALVDRQDQRVLAARSHARWLVAAPQITHLRLRGRGPVTVQGWMASSGRSIEALLGQPPFASLSAPIAGDRPWYAGGEGPAVALKRVQEGAPLRWTRPDRPDGPFDGLSPADELARVAAMQADLDDEVERLFGDADTAPAAVQRSQIFLAAVLANGKRRAWQRATEQVQDSVLMKALDPGAGRYLGLATLLADLPLPADPFRPPIARAWLAAGLFAVGKEMVFELPDADVLERRLIERLMQLQPGVDRVAALAAQRHGLTIRAFVASALAAPPPDLPAAPQVLLGEAGWQRADDGPSTLFRQQLRVAAPPLATLLALARLEPAGWTTRHERVDLTAATPGADPAERAAPRMLGTTHRRTEDKFGIATDSDVDAAAAPWTYRVALADVFGRFGPARDIDVPVPARPPLPQPALRAHLSLAERAVGNGSAVAGSVRLTLVVPALHEMTAGSRPLARAVVALGGVTQDAATAQEGGPLAFDFDLPALLPMERRTLNATAFFEDDAGGTGAAATLPVKLCDPRSPPVPRTGIGIVWSSRPAPATDVEFRLRFSGVPGARYRAYLSDSRGLDLALFEGDRPRTRAEIAVDGAQRGLAGLGLRERFRLLTDEPLKPAADGRVLFDTRLPRALETVQFLRFVPLSGQGAEAPFESCPLLPIAVPSSHAPPAPRIETVVDPVTAVASVTVRAVGLDLVALQSAEPGLFIDPGDPAAADAVAPTYRLRRASGGVPEALYAREIGRGALQREGDEFVATTLDAPTASGLSAYVRYHYWAEVQMPAERRLPPGVAELPLPAGSVEPAQGAQSQDAPGAYSAVSAPAVAMFVPSAVPALTAEMVTATVGAGAVAGTWRLTLAIAGGPVAHARAVGPFRVRLHLQVDGGNWTPEPGDTALTGGALALPPIDRPGAAVPALGVALVLVDPIGREADPLIFDAVPV